MSRSQVGAPVKIVQRSKGPGSPGAKFMGVASSTKNPWGLVQEASSVRGCHRHALTLAQQGQAIDISCKPVAYFLKQMVSGLS